MNLLKNIDQIRQDVREIRDHLLKEKPIEEPDEPPVEKPDIPDEPEPSPDYNLQKFNQWKDEIPVDLLSDDYRHQLASSILERIPSTGNRIIVENTVEESLENCSDGDTLVIPDGTFEVNNLKIDKSIHIELNGVLRRKEESKSTYMLSLEKPCEFSGGQLDSNFEYWKDKGTGNRLYLINVNAPSIIRNVKALDCARKDNGFNFGGFHTNVPALFEYCEAEHAARPFRSLNAGSFEDFTGVYFYKCGALKYGQKGFAVDGGTHGYIVLDSCYGEEGKWDIMPQEFAIFETGPKNKIHTVLIKNTNFSGFTSANLLKGVNCKYVVVVDSTFKTNGFLCDSSTRTKANPLGPAKVWRWQLDNPPSEIDSQSLILVNSYLESEDRNDGYYPYRSADAGRTIPIFARYKQGSFYSIGSHLKWKSNLPWGDGPIAPKELHFKNTTLEVDEPQQHYGGGDGFIRLRGDTDFDEEDITIEGGKLTNHSGSGMSPIHGL